MTYKNLNIPLIFPLFFGWLFHEQNLTILKIQMLNSVIFAWWNTGLIASSSPFVELIEFSGSHEALAYLWIMHAA